MRRVALPIRSAHRAGDAGQVVVELRRPGAQDDRRLGIAALSRRRRVREERVEFGGVTAGQGLELRTVALRERERAVVPVLRCSDLHLRFRYLPC
jgi:hypothetical protein